MVGKKDLVPFIVRRRFDLQTAIFVLAIFAAMATIAWEYQVFLTASAQPAQARSVELEQAIGLVGLLVGGIAVFAVQQLRHQRDSDQRIAAEHEARRLALEDPLTGLPNRRQFEDALKTALGSPPRFGASHGMLLLDLNGFKKVNDLHGHAAGDAVLTIVGHRLKQAVRESDLVARLGGDEFAVLAPHMAGPEAAASIAMRIIEQLDEPIEASGALHSIGTAIGIALVPQDGIDKQEIMRKADIALYRAKGLGRSALRFFETEMDTAIRERDLIERQLRIAIDAEQIQPFYQPLVKIGSGEIIGFEALARWTHPEIGEIEPARFIPIAEDCGLIGELTDQLLRRACLDAAAWPAEVFLSFNISPVQLRDPTFGLRVMTILGETGLAPQRLEIEITESALVQDLEGAQATLGSLRDAGIRIALDDFGTGYSSLYHLRNFKLDTIKIDRSFVQSMCFDRDSAAIVKALVGLGSGLCLNVTAEGVEDVEQQALLQAQGCDRAQGFLFSQAVSAAEAAKLLGARTDASQPTTAARRKSA